MRMRYAILYEDQDGELAGVNCANEEIADKIRDRADEAGLLIRGKIPLESIGVFAAKVAEAERQPGYQSPCAGGRIS